MPTFFFSYSRADARDEFLDAFYQDLCDEVSARGGIDRDLVGFLDREQKIGSHWPRSTGEAVGSCDVLVPIYSPHYFGSQFCGQEWHAFSRRLEGSGGSGPGPSILPVWWLPPKGPVPAVVAPLHDARDLHGPEYRDFGLRYLSQLKENREQYTKFLVQFSLAIIDAAGHAPPKLETFDLRQEPNAFASSPAVLPATTPPAPGGRAKGSSGPRKVTFVVAAEGAEQMTGRRDALEVYGQDWSEWRPYSPGCDDAAVVLAQGVATTRKMLAIPQRADEKLFDLLEHARLNNEIIVILIDPWAIDLPHYQDLFDRLDRMMPLNSAVLVPWAGLERTPEATPVRGHLHELLGSWMLLGNHVFREGMPSETEFQEELGVLLVEIRRRIVNRANVRRLVPSGPGIKPTINGPGA